MSKRKLQDEEEVFVDNPALAPASSNNGKHSRKISDVVDNGRDCDYIQPGPSTPVKKKSPHPDLVSLDQGHKLESPSRKTSTIPERMLRKPDHVDATPTPPSVVHEYEEHEAYEGTPNGIQVPMTIAKDAEHYDMSHPNRGTCVIFNHADFEDPNIRRPGSNVDVERIDATFSKLGFDVVVHDNLEYCDIMNKIKTLSHPDNHTNSDSVCVFVLTHGLNDGLLMAKDVAYKSDRIWKAFTADNCPTLAGKPKLFFLQACRGKKLDGGVRMMMQANHRTRDQIDHIASYTIPTHADFLIAHSCVDGFYSWRNPEEGTWYVQTLCKVLDQFAGSTDLLKMLTITARKVADFESYNDQNPQMNAQKQVSSLTSTLTRDLYFTPK